MKDYAHNTMEIQITNVENIENRIHEEISSYMIGIEDTKDFESVESLQSFFVEFLAIMRTQANILGLSIGELRKTNKSFFAEKESLGRINSSLIKFRY